MYERLLLIEAGGDGRVILNSGRGPVGVPIDHATALPTRGRRVRVPEWIVDSSAVLAASLLRDEPPVNVARWWANVAHLTPSDAERRREEFAQGHREAVAECNQRLREPDVPQTFVDAHAEGTRAMKEYGDDMLALTNDCIATLHELASRCRSDVIRTRDDALAVDAAAEQLRAAYDAPMPAKAAAQWRMRVAEIVEEETEKCKKRLQERAEAAARDIQETTMPSLPAHLTRDPALKLYATPVVAALVDTYARQVDMHMIERLRGAAEACAPYLHTSIEKAETTML